MRKLGLILLSVLMSMLVPPILMAQHELSVDKLNAEWVRLYEAGCGEFQLNNLGAAASSFRNALSLLQENEAQNTNSYIYTIIKLAEVYYGSHADRELAALETEIQNIGKSIRPGSRKHLNYSYSLSLYYSNTGQYAKAISVLETQLQNRKLFDDYPEFEGMLMHRKALCYHCLGKEKEAIEIEEQCVRKCGETPENLQTLVHFLFVSGRYDEMRSWLTQCFNVSREPVLQKFTFSNALERNAYWSQHHLFFTDWLPVYASKCPSDMLSGCCYDAMLLSKGILLAASNKTTDLILGGSNSQLIDSYNRYNELKGKKNKTVDEEFEMDALYDTFVRYQANHKKAYRQDFRIGWKEIQKQLSVGDAAIEFLSVKADAGVEYAALVLKKDYNAPHFVKLCSEKQLRSVAPGKFYVSSELYDLIWRPIVAELNDVEKIYFSPVGDLHKIGIEYLPDDGGLNVNNLYQIYRLSSTKELALHSAGCRQKCAVIFGGIDYDTVSPMSSKSKEKYSDKPGENLLNDMSEVHGISRGRAVEYLPGTMTEVRNISDILRSGGYKVSLYTDSDASENHLKNQELTNCRILHIATHGFYWCTSKTSSYDNLERSFRNQQLHFVNKDILLKDEDKMLTHSGLLFAGVNKLLVNTTLVDGEGIFYASEASCLNLMDVELLVLSACQSGLGDIVDGEGVFGLQRGFKLAGVKSMLISLWSVNDEATGILMSEFYKNVAEGQKYNEALSNAQIFLRMIDDGKYDFPEYWAAFVLLDAVS